MQLIIDDEDTFQDLLNALSEINEALSKRLILSVFGSINDYVEYVIVCACAVHNISREEIKHTRKLERLYARHHAIVYITTVIKLTDAATAHLFERERSTMNNSRKKHEELYGRDRYYTDSYNRFINLIKLQYADKERNVVAR